MIQSIDLIQISLVLHALIFACIYFYAILPSVLICVTDSTVRYRTVSSTQIFLTLSFDSHTLTTTPNLWQPQVCSRFYNFFILRMLYKWNDKWIFKTTNLLGINSNTRKLWKYKFTGKILILKNCNNKIVQKYNNGITDE